MLKEVFIVSSPVIYHTSVGGAGPPSLLPVRQFIEGQLSVYKVDVGQNENWWHLSLHYNDYRAPPLLQNPPVCWLAWCDYPPVIILNTAGQMKLLAATKVALIMAHNSPAG